MLPVILFFVSLLTFSVAYSVPPLDRARAAMDKQVTQARLESIIRENGWDQPFLVQYARYMGGVFRGDLGRSVERRSHVSEDIAAKFPATAELAILSMLIAVSAGVALGVTSAVYRGKALDYGSMLLALGGVSIPVFWLALLVKGLIIANLDIPLLGRGDVEVITGFYLIDSAVAGDVRQFADCLRRLLVPAVVLATVPMAVITRIARASMLEVLGSDYIRTAYAKGLPGDVVLLKHALRNAALPILTIAGMQLGYLLGGAVLTETIFDWDGLGKYVAQAVLANDFQPVQGGVLVMASSFVLVNLGVDVLYAWIDPRVRLG